MTSRVNELGQPIGDTVPDWSPPPRPPRALVEGRYCRVEPIQPHRHAEDLHAANITDSENRIWTYMPYGPFSELKDYRAWMEKTCLGDDPLFHAIIDAASGKAVGVASYLRIAPASGSIEVGHINYSPLLQRTPAATEAMFLMMRTAFDLGYRRYEWKCDAANAGSRRAAERLGFVFEGVFRQATVYKGRNRDTAWYAIIDKDWPDIRSAFEAWLAADNFAPDGRQIRTLSEFVQSAPR